MLMLFNKILDVFQHTLSNDSEIFTDLFPAWPDEYLSNNTPRGASSPGGKRPEGICLEGICQR